MMHILRNFVVSLTNPTLIIYVLLSGFYTLIKILWEKNILNDTDIQNLVDTMMETNNEVNKNIYMGK